MSQKRNKIIVLVFLIFLLVICLGGFWLIKKQKYSSKILDFDQKVEILNQGCKIPNGGIFQICRYSLFQKAIPLMQLMNIQQNNIQISVPMVDENSIPAAGNLAILKLDLPLLLSLQKQKITNNHFSLCFEISPALQLIKAAPLDKVSFNSQQIVCTKTLEQNDLSQFNFIGTIIPIQKESDIQTLQITVWLVPSYLGGIKSITDFQTYRKDLNLIGIFLRPFVIRK